VCEGVSIGRDPGPCQRPVRPLAGEDRVDELALPLALDPLVLDEVRLAAHAELLEHAGGADVAWLQPTDDTVEAESLEREREHRPRRLRRVALPLVRRMDEEAELALAMDLARPEERDVRDELVALA